MLYYVLLHGWWSHGRLVNKPVRWRDQQASSLFTAGRTGRRRIASWPVWAIFVKHFFVIVRSLSFALVSILRRASRRTPTSGILR